MIGKTQVDKDSDQPAQLKQAAFMLSDHLCYMQKPPKWLHTVGIGNLELVIYTKLRRTPKLPDHFGKWPVRVEYVGQVTAEPAR